ncbi:MAG: class II fructose-bisphosphate aldolase [Ruminococcaceae bacterium]|nr:class II fructose-bisphosphate aldolase [Oscillospiraceae bacterium]
MKRRIKKAQEGKYAVGLFNTTDTDMLEGVIAAAEELNSPVVIGTAEILLPYGEQCFRWREDSGGSIGSL